MAGAEGARIFPGQNYRSRYKWKSDKDHLGQWSTVYPLKNGAVEKGDGADLLSLAINLCRWMGIEGRFHEDDQV